MCTRLTSLISARSPRDMMDRCISALIRSSILVKLLVTRSIPLIPTRARFFLLPPFSRSPPPYPLITFCLSIPSSRLRVKANGKFLVSGIVGRRKRASVPRHAAMRSTLIALIFLGLHISAPSSRTAISQATIAEELFNDARNKTPRGTIYNTASRNATATMMNFGRESVGLEE